MKRRAVDETRVVLDAFRRVVRALREGSRASEKAVGLSAAQLFVLQRLAQRPALSLGELAEQTFTHQSSVSVVVSRLVERGLVRRARSPLDARRVALAVTPLGRLLLAQAPDAAQQWLIDAVERLPARSRTQLAEALLRLVAEMAIEDAEPAMLFEEPPPPRPRRRRERD
jgi:DNA-binding MarR family transcriptional regulator